MMQHGDARMVARAMLLQLGAEHILEAHQDQLGIGFAVQEGNCGRNRDGRAMVTAHAVDRNFYCHCGQDAIPATMPEPAVSTHIGSRQAGIQHARMPGNAQGKARHAGRCSGSTKRKSGATIKLPRAPLLVFGRNQNADYSSFLVFSTLRPR
jgi:hypothetical protein